MTADADLPVWTIKPNWDEGVTERLSWLTDVLASTYGTEQRRALRLSPRREFEMKFNPVDQVRSYFDLWLHRMGSFEFMVPLFHDSGRMTAAAAIGAVTIFLDTTYREFEADGFAILIGDDPFTFDKVSISAVAADRLTVTGVTQAWPAGTRVHPLRRSRLSDESQAAAITNRVGEATLQFQLNQANDIDDEGVWDTIYAGYPVIENAPNRRENIDLTFNRNTLLLDNDLGLRVLNDDAGRAFTLQVDNRMMTGRAEHWAFRQMLYRLRGQQGGIWLPTFNRDIELSRAALTTDNFINIKKIGYAYTGGRIDGRDHIMLPGGHCSAISSLGGAPTAAEEHLALSAPLGTAWPAGTFASFMDVCRLASDDIEIKHHTDTDGVAESNLSFRSFRDPRTPPSVIDSPIPSVSKVFAMCGAPAVEESSCVPAFETGMWGEFVIRTDIGTDTPVIFPWSWSMTLSRGGVVQGGISAADSAYTTYHGGRADAFALPYIPMIGWESKFLTPDIAVPLGEDGFADDPFAAGDPDMLHINIQWPYTDWILHGTGVAIMGIKFHRIGGGTIDFGEIPIVGLFPSSYDIPAP